MKIRSAGRTDIGRKRQNNEDWLLVDEGLGLFVVADGIGGQSGGEVASRMAVETLRGRLQELGSAAGEETNAAALASGFRTANRRILESAVGNPALEGMGTTLTALLLRGADMHVAHVGDSRAYLLRDGSLEQITDDHGLVAEQVRAGLATPEQAKRSPYRHIITRALGMRPDLEIDLRTFGTRQGDVFLVCSDGLTEMVEDRMIERILQEHQPEQAVAELIAAANGNGGVDNISVVVVRIGDR